MTPQHSCQTTEVTVNGEIRLVPSDINILQLLRWLGVDPQRVAVELNRNIVRQPHWESTPVPPGAQLEIVQFVGGG